MVQDTRAHDFIECQSEVANAIDRQLMDLEIGQIVLAAEIIRVPHAGRADVDSDDPRRGQRAACFAACDVPQPAIRIVRASANGFSGQNR